VQPVGPPVVLVHGMASSFDLNWRRTGLADLLADAGREVLAVDLLGHGAAPAPRQPEAYADLTARVVEVLPDEPVDAVGFSLGAHVLLETARNDPGRFGRLVLAGVGDTLLGPQDREPLARALEASSGCSCAWPMAPTPTRSRWPPCCAARPSLSPRRTWPG
jgi:pimeloyl-ACP methyl ester carboxylesterase